MENTDIKITIEGIGEDVRLLRFFRISTLADCWSFVAAAISASFSVAPPATSDESADNFSLTSLAALHSSGNNRSRQLAMPEFHALLYLSVQQQPPSRQPSLSLADLASSLYADSLFVETCVVWEHHRHCSPARSALRQLQRSADREGLRNRS